MKAVAIACGTSSAGDRARIRRSLEHDFQGRRVLLVVDEAQHLSINAFETLRILLDRPPRFSLLFAGSHDLKRTFDRFASVLEQWYSRLVDKVLLPGVAREEAEALVQRDLADWLGSMEPNKARKLVHTLVDNSVAQDAFELDDKHNRRAILRPRNHPKDSEERCCPCSSIAQLRAARRCHRLACLA